MSPKRPLSLLPPLCCDRQPSLYRPSPHRSPLDEESIHQSFSQLIAEQTRNEEESEALELQRLQRDLEDESRGSDAAPISSSPLSFLMNK